MDLRNLIYKELDEVTASLSESVVMGAHQRKKSAAILYAEYLRTCGKIAGLKMAKDIIEETYRKHLNE